jgi:hypothetical protein
VDPLVATAAQRPDLFRRGSELTADIWPVYNTHGQVLSVYWHRLAEEFPEFQFVVYDGETEQVLGQGHSMPCAWDGTVDGLPAGIDEVVERGFDPGAAGRRGALSGLAVEVPRGNQGRGLSRHVVGGMRSIAARHGMGAVIVPLRPVLKERYPLVPIERYVQWARADGSPFDPWIRVHTELGGAILKPAPRSLKITGSVQEWEAWTQMAFPESGDYVIPQGLALLSVDRAAGMGTYFEPNVWIHHHA